jgi:hypothetical protein
MKKLLFVIISTVMVSGLLLGSMGSDVFALSEKGQAKGCDPANPGQAKNNPHCDQEPPCDKVTLYQDRDADGFGNSSITSGSFCVDEDPLWVVNNTDCDDTKATVNPDQTEIPGNGDDDDCNPATVD